MMSYTTIIIPSQEIILKKQTKTAVIYNFYFFHTTVIVNVSCTNIKMIGITNLVHQNVARLYLGHLVRFEFSCAYKKWDNHD